MSVQDFVNCIMAGLDPRIGWEGLRLAAEALLLKDEHERIEENYGEYGYLSGRLRLDLLQILILSVIVGLISLAVGRVARNFIGAQHDEDGKASSAIS